jgi:hypothetical protein
MEFDYAPEWHNVTLPSKGMLYGDKLQEGMLQITPWTVAQEEAIARNSEGEQKDLTHELLRTNVKWPQDFSYEDLLLTDQFFLLLNLRIISFIDAMTLPYKCPECDSLQEVEVKLSEIMVKTAEETDPEEPYSVFLPRRKINVTVRQQRVGDLLAAEKYLKSALTEKPERRRVFLYARQIVQIDEQTIPFDEKLKFVQILSLLDLTALADVPEKYSTGVQGTYAVECSKCKALDKRWVPEIHSDFFRPKSTDIARACQLAKED